MPISSPCQESYYQSIMNLHDPCGANKLTHLLNTNSKICMHPGCLPGVYELVVFRIFLRCRATCGRESKKTPDPESSTRNVRHYPVELSTQLFISIKTCNNAGTLSRNCFLPFGSVQLDCWMGEGVVPV